MKSQRENPKRHAAVTSGEVERHQRTTPPGPHRQTHARNWYLVELKQLKHRLV